MKVLMRITGVTLFILWTVLFALTILVSLFLTPVVYIFRGADGVSRYWESRPAWLNFLDTAEEWMKA